MGSRTTIRSIVLRLSDIGLPFEYQHQQHDVPECSSCKTLAMVGTSYSYSKNFLQILLLVFYLFHLLWLWTTQRRTRTHASMTQDRSPLFVVVGPLVLFCRASAGAVLSFLFWCCSVARLSFGAVLFSVCLLVLFCCLSVSSCCSVVCLAFGQIPSRLFS